MELVSWEITSLISCQGCSSWARLEFRSQSWGPSGEQQNIKDCWAVVAARCRIGEEGKRTGGRGRAGQEQKAASLDQTTARSSA